MPNAERGRGRIRVIAARDGDDVIIDVIDNGIGCRRKTATACSNPMSPPARRAPDWDWPSSGHPGGARRRHRASRRLGKIPRRARRVDAAALCGRAVAENAQSELNTVVSES